MKHLSSVLVLTLLSGLVACGSRGTDTSASSPGAAPAAESASAAATEPAATVAAELKQAASATQESAGTETSSGDAALERLAAMPESAQLPGGRWKAGTNYRPIVPAQGTNAEPGQVEVIEVLWLGCPHCYELQPFVDSWKAKKPAYVKFTQEHVMWGPVHRAHGRLFYTLETLGKGQLLTKAFDEIHRRGNMLVSNDDAATERMQLAFAQANGISETDFKREYNGFAVNTRLQKAEELSRRYRVEGVPLVLVNGKYATDVSMAGGHEELLQLVNDLAAAEKSR